MLSDLQKELRGLADAKKAVLLAGFFKTGKGQYGEGDVFLGITVPKQRDVARKYRDLPIKDVEKLLASRIHEERLTALLILIEQYRKHPEKRKAIFDFVLAHTKGINNWDLVDASSHVIVGHYLLDKDRKILYKLAKSKDLWERRIAMVSTSAFIHQGQLDDALYIAEILMPDTHDLTHKAVGWMLREVGKKDQAVLEAFLRKHIRKLPRTTLRYAIERFPEKKRQTYLKM